MSPVVSGIGKLYRIDEEEAIASVNYQIRANPSAFSSQWMGEIVLRDAVDIGDGGLFVIELEDGSRGKCALKKMINRATSSVPPRFVYRLTGSGSLK